MDVLMNFSTKNTMYFDAFDKMVEAVYICDIDGNLVYFNKVAERLDGYLLKDVKGQSTYDLYGLDERNSPMLKALATERPVHNEEFSIMSTVRKMCNYAMPALFTTTENLSVLIRCSAI